MTPTVSDGPSETDDRAEGARGSGRSTGEGPAPTDPDRGVSRRHLLWGSTAVGAVAGAGCLGGPLGGGDGNRLAPSVYVFNTGDRTVSVLDPDAMEVVETVGAGLTASFPSNQYSPGLVTDPDDHLWVNVSDGVAALRAGDLSEAARVETGAGANWLERTPDGNRVVVSAREPAHRQFLVDADPDSGSFGEALASIDRGEGTGEDREGPGPCDVTFAPGGDHAFVPDLFGDTLTVLRVDPFEVVAQVDVDPVVEGVDEARPWMGTAALDGDRLAVEHDEGDGAESIWDVSDPTDPEEVARLTTADGLGENPLTSEIAPDDRTLFVFTPDTEDVTVVDVREATVEGRIDLGGVAYTGTWDPDRRSLFVPVQTSDEVAVIDPDEREVVERIPVGASPYGATAGGVRPEASMGGRLLADLVAAGVDTGGEMTYCRGECHCGAVEENRE
ncbi:hypothetical protein BRD00_02260 [Halobacteriales archaeon QS_8_69_26]|nr:MAG: hypothetical protein BRD00_02260 [Halobacteriales archaeon QS_8_69_26]